MTRLALESSSGKLIAPRESRAKTGDDNNVFFAVDYDSYPATRNVPSAEGVYRTRTPNLIGRNEEHDSGAIEGVKEK